MSELTSGNQDAAKEPVVGGELAGPVGNILSFRWHVTTFVGILLTIIILIYGGYRPWMRSMSNRNIVEGDAFRLHALQLRSDTAMQLTDLDELDDHINLIYQTISTYYELGRMGGASMFDQGNPLNRRIVTQVAALEPIIKRSDEICRQLGQKNHLTDSFSFLFDHLNKRTANLHSRLSVTSGLPYNEFTYPQEYTGICYTALPDYLETIKKIRDLFLVEPGFDNAMTSYMNAITLSRSWSVPRLRMADLYRDRKWPEVAMMEYLRVIKLDPHGADGERAMVELKKYLGKNPEADFHVGLAQLFLGDEAAGVHSLKRFLATQPVNVNAPKVAELLGYIEAGNRTFVKQYLRDEIWI